MWVTSSAPSRDTSWLLEASQRVPLVSGSSFSPAQASQVGQHGQFSTSARMWRRLAAFSYISLDPSYFVMSFSIGASASFALAYYISENGSIGLPHPVIILLKF